MRAALIATLALTLLAGCAPKRTTVSVTVVVRGSPEAAEKAKAALAKPLGAVEPRIADVPGAGNIPAGAGAIEARIAAARSRYVDADFTACLQSLAGDSLVEELLGGERRATATRLLLWRVACHSGANAEALAMQSARELAILGLELPSEVAAVSPNVEILLARALKEIAATKRVPLSVKSDVAPAIVALDGRPAVCSAPCSIDVAPGDHVVKLDADGALPSVRKIRVAPPATALDIVTVPAPPEMAAWQWTSRYGALGDVDSAPSLRLLSVALRAQRLALIDATGQSGSVRLRGVLAVGGEIVARAERRNLEFQAVEPGSQALLRDLLIRGKVVENTPLVRRWTFWVALAAGSLLAGGAATAVFYEPPTRTEVSF